MDALELVDQFKDLILFELWVLLAQFDSLHLARGDCEYVYRADIYVM